jgi:hypothetical protein
MGQSGIDNPGTLATFGTQVTGRRQNTHTHTHTHHNTVN